MDAEKLPKDVTPAELKKLIAKHGPLHPVSVPVDGRRVNGLFKKPTLAIISAAAAAGVNDPLKTGEVLYANCKVQVDPEMDSDEEVHLAAIQGVNRLFRLLQVEVGEPLRGE